MSPAVFGEDYTSASGRRISKLYQHFRERDFPYGLQSSLCTLTSYLVHELLHSSMRSTLDTGGWLALTRRGLSPRKIR